MGQWLQGMTGPQGPTAVLASYKAQFMGLHGLWAQPLDLKALYMELWTFLSKDRQAGTKVAGTGGVVGGSEHPKILGPVLSSSRGLHR